MAKMKPLPQSVEPVAEDKRFTETELATRWEITTRTLQGWRATGVGPAYLDLGNNTIRYRVEDVIAYEESRLKNTGEEK